MNTAQFSSKYGINIAYAPLSIEEKRPCVLVAQENETTRKSLKESLNLYNLKIIEADSGEAAVDGAVTHRPDLIIMDHDLSGLSSFEAIRVIRSISSLNIVPILFLDNQSQPFKFNQAFAAGCDDYLAKPLDLNRLGKLLEKFLFLKGA